MPVPFTAEEIRRDAEAAMDTSAAAIATTAARALVLGSALASPVSLQGLTTDLPTIGLTQLPSHWGGWRERLQLLDSSDDVLRRFDLLNEIQARERSDWRADDRDSSPRRPARVDLWSEVAADGSRTKALA